MKNCFHPGLTQLIRAQSRARWSRLYRSIRSPRRKIATAIGMTLAAVWLGQAVVGIFLRESADPEKLAVWIPLGLFCYTAWHLLKIVGRKPVEPFEWTPAETEWLLAAPLPRVQVVAYRMASILTAAIVKAALFAALMMPDLNFFLAGFLGMLVGLLLVDIIRIAIELICYSLSRWELNVLRLLLFGSLAGWAATCFLACLEHVNSVEHLSSPAALIFTKHWLLLVTTQVTTHGALLMSWFLPATELMLAERIDMGFWLVAGKVVVALGIAASVIFPLDRFAQWRRGSRERRVLLNASRDQPVHPGRSEREANGYRWCRATFVPPYLGGAGSVAWRQLCGAYHYRATLAISLGLPVILCCLPLLADHGEFHMLINLVSGIVFYSFLLLPAALMLDFRRDVHRMDLLKSLPIGPWAMTLGQLTAPVLLCSLFQWTVLAIGVVSGSIHWWQMILAGILLIPFSIFIFASENLVFMMAPYRRNQEGLMTFVRTILTFTAKGVFLGLVLVSVIGWALFSRSAGGWFSNPDLMQPLVFGFGIWLGTLTMAVAATWQLAKTCQRFDPSCDAPM